jgi:hypothetical protein
VLGRARLLNHKRYEFGYGIPLPLEEVMVAGLLSAPWADDFRHLAGKEFAFNFARGIDTTMNPASLFARMAVIFLSDARLARRWFRLWSEIKHIYVRERIVYAMLWTDEAVADFRLAQIVTSVFVLYII